MAGTRSYGLGRTKQLQIRVTPQEHTALHTEATKRGFSSASEFARYVCLQALPDLDRAQQELDELAGLESQVQNLANTIRARHGMGGR